MPLFDFKCDRCFEEKEKMVKVGEPVLCECGKQMTQQVGKVHFELKGKGWFKDGYK